MSHARSGAFMMRKTSFLVAGVATLALATASCAVDNKTGSRTGTGAAVGAAAGATVGLLSGNFLASTLTGAAAGAAGGFVYDQMKK
jgi:osmotically inducible lipoprotein OsmB